MEYSIFDAHCDTISEIFENKTTLLKNELHIDCDRMSKYFKYIQVFAAFADKKAIDGNLYERIEKVINTYKIQIRESDISFCNTAEDIEKAEKGAILSIEGGEALEGKLENLEKFYEDGVRIITLTWNHPNEIADGIAVKDGMGLTDFGKLVVREMNEMGMVIDVSHISEKGFWDVAFNSQRPFIASHSNVKAICANPRNLDDCQIKEIINNQGVIGINFYPVFLDDTGYCKMERILDHIDYILDMGGENNIGFGSDFDGIPYLPDDMRGIESMENLISLMEKRGYGKSIIKKIAYDNFVRVLKANFA